MIYYPKNIFNKRSSSIQTRITTLEESTGKIFPPIYKAYVSEYKVEENNPNWIIINNEEELFSYLVFFSRDEIKMGFDTFNSPLDIIDFSKNSDGWIATKRWPIGVTDSGDTILLGTNTDEIDTIFLENSDSGKATMIAPNVIEFIASFVHEIDRDLLDKISLESVYKDFLSDVYKTRAPLT